MDLQATLIVAISAIGFISLSQLFVKFIIWVWVTFFRSAKNLKEDYGSWAVVTGSTDGIGKAMALELASQGLNLVLVARNASKLQTTSNAIRELHGSKVDVKCIAIDFSKVNSTEILDKMEEGINGLDVGILVNNVGVAYPSPKYFHEVDSELIDTIVRVNINATTWVTRAVLPVMLKKKKGAIVNVGSGSAILSSFPLYTVYAATKTYIGMFTRCINLEYKQQGIDIQCQIPLLVATKMTPMTRYSLFAPPPDMYSRESVRWIGYGHTCIPYWIHSIKGGFLRSLPAALFNRLLFHYILSVREKGVLKILWYGF